MIHSARQDILSAESRAGQDEQRAGAEVRVPGDHAERRDPSDIEIIGHLPLVRDGDGQPEPDASMANLGRLVEAGVTNVDVFLPAPTEYDAAVDYLALWAEAFHKALP